MPLELQSFEYPSEETMLDLMRCAGAVVTWAYAEDSSIKRTGLRLQLVLPDGGALLYRGRVVELSALLKDAYRDYLLGSFTAAAGPRQITRERYAWGMADVRGAFGTSLSLEKSNGN